MVCWGALGRDQQANAGDSFQLRLVGALRNPDAPSRTTWNVRGVAALYDRGRVREVAGAGRSKMRRAVAGTRAQGARSAAAAIRAACSAVVTLQVAAAASLRVFAGADCDALEPLRLARRTFAPFPRQPSHSPTLADFCPGGQCTLRDERQCNSLAEQALLAPRGGA